MSTVLANKIERNDGGHVSLGKAAPIIAYAQVEQTTSGHPVGVSFNISSTTDNGSGLTGFTYTNNTSISKHAVTFTDNGQNMSGSAGGINSFSNYASATQQKRTSGCGVDARQYDNTNRDKDDVSIMSAGALA